MAPAFFTRRPSQPKCPSACRLLFASSPFGSTSSQTNGAVHIDIGRAALRGRHTPAQSLRLCHPLQSLQIPQGFGKTPPHASAHSILLFGPGTGVRRASIMPVCIDAEIPARYNRTLAPFRRVRRAISHSVGIACTRHDGDTPLTQTTWPSPAFVRRHAGTHACRSRVVRMMKCRHSWRIDVCSSLNR